MKSTVVVGSQAMKHHYPDFPRIPQDTDVIISKADYQKAIENQSDIVYIKENPNGASAVVKFDHTPTPFEYLFSDGVRSLELILEQLCTDSPYASVKVLYSLKKAHIHFPIKFDKHIRDLMFLREKLRQEKQISLEADLNSPDDLLDSYPALTLTHFSETERRLGKLKTPKMNQSTEEFFGKSKKYVKSYYVHDNMHLAMKHAHEPIYKWILKDWSEVETDERKWELLTIQEKIWCVLEEVYVIALERKILPNLFEPEVVLFGEINPCYTPKEAFDWALMRVCTTLCDGFFREFAVRAYDEIQKQYNPQYVELFFKNIDKYEKTNVRIQDHEPENPTLS